MAGRILLVEDDEDVRCQWSRSLQAHPQFEVQAEAATLAAALQYLQQQHFDLVLLDLGLPDGDGVRLIESAGAMTPPPQVIVLTQLRDEQHIVDALAAGAVGYLFKDQPPVSLGEAVLQTLAGGSVLSPSVARHLLTRLRPPPDAPVTKDGFTAREREILQLIAQGYSYSEVASALDVSFNTVATHIQHLYHKLAVHSRGEAVAEALQRGIVDLGLRKR